MNTYEYASMFREAVISGLNSNTYKPCFARALVLAVSDGDATPLEDGIYRVDFISIARRMLANYWNQTCFFGLRQSAPHVQDKSPIILQCTQDLIIAYRKLSGSNKPTWFSDALPVLEKESSGFYEKRLSEIVKVLPQNVVPRFPNVGKEHYPLYEFDRRTKALYLSEDAINAILETKDFLLDAIDSKWAKLLEQYNTSPRIYSKVSAASLESMPRSSLHRQREALMKAEGYVDIADFYTGEILDSRDISVDHVIPWSYLFLDELWDLVLTSFSNNSIKSDTFPSRESIERLKKRNADLLDKLPDGQFRKEIGRAVELKLVDRYYEDFMVDYAVSA